MRIEAAARRYGGDEALLSATVTWEDTGLPPQPLTFAVPAEHADLLDDSPDAAVAARAPVAAVAGERRIAADGACPVLVEGLRTAVAWLRDWYPDIVGPLRVEGDPDDRRERPPDRVAGALLSGGTDSLALLAANHAAVPPGHPSRVERCVHVCWGDVPRSGPLDPRRLAAATGVGVVVVRSDYRDIMTKLPRGRLPLWRNVLHGAAFAAAGHALARGLRELTIASSHHVGTLGPSGSHPVLDPLYSSGYLAFRHEPNLRSRLDKTRLVAAWPEALEVLRVCVGPHEARAARQNCGRCEKCVRTAAALLAVGSDPARVPGLEPVTAATIRSAGVSSDYVAGFYRDLGDGLDREGHHALATAVQDRLRRYRWRRRARPIKRVVRRVVG